MMPMPLKWCFACNLTGCLIDLALTLTNHAPPSAQSRQYSQFFSKLIIYFTTNLICLYTKYLIDLAQRNAFLETRRSMDTRAKIERENDKQEKLLLSLLPRFVALEIIEDIAKEDNHELFKPQFHKIYIHSYKDVR